MKIGCVAPAIEYAWCQFKMTSSKCPYRSHRHPSVSEDNGSVPPSLST